MDTAANGSAPTPLGLLAELTHRCPLGCPYCSNPLALDRRPEELDTQTWARVFGEAAALGILQVHLSGGEPGARRDLVEIAAAARETRSEERRVGKEWSVRWGRYVWQKM